MLRKPKGAEMSTLARTYQRRYRQVFCPWKVEGTLPYSSKNKAQKGKKKMTKVDEHEEDMQEDEEAYLDLVDLDQLDDHEASILVFKEKDAQII